MAAKVICCTAAQRKAPATNSPVQASDQKDATKAGNPKDHSLNCDSVDRCNQRGHRSCQWLYRSILYINNSCRMYIRCVYMHTVWTGIPLTEEILHRRKHIGMIESHNHLWTVNGEHEGDDSKSSLVVQGSTVSLCGAVIYWWCREMTSIYILSIFDIHTMCVCDVCHRLPIMFLYQPKRAQLAQSQQTCQTIPSDSQRISGCLHVRPFDLFAHLFMRKSCESHAGQGSYNRIYQKTR